MRFTEIRWAAKMLPRDLSHSSSEGGQMQGIMGAVISQSSSATFFFWDARCFAIFTAVTVLPQPGLPQTGKDSAAGFLDDFNLLRLCAAVKPGFLS